MAKKTDLKRAGSILTQWHSSMSDPIYAVGSFYIDGTPYPDEGVLEEAIQGATGCIEMAESPRDVRDLQFAIGIMKDELAASEEQEWPKAGLDTSTLDEFVRMEAESLEMSDPEQAEATDEVLEEAQKFEVALQKALLELEEERPPANGATAFDLYASEGPYLVLMTLMGAGVSIHDDWTEFYDDDELEEVSDFLKSKLSRFADDTGGGSLVDAFNNAAFETGGEYEEEE